MFKQIASIAAMFFYMTMAQAQCDCANPAVHIFKADFVSSNFIDDSGTYVPPQAEVSGSITLRYTDFKQGFGEVTALDLGVVGIVARRRNPKNST